jgi:2-methylcitrate dehydratase PrpD
MLGPVVPGTTVFGGARVPGTEFKLDPIKAAFDISTSIRWLEHNDTWFGKDSGHPSDNLGAIIAVADYLCRNRGWQRRQLKVMDVLSALIKVYEIQGQLLVNNDFTGLGLDSVATVTVASSAVVTRMLGGSRDQVVNAMSNAWLDGVSLQLYRIAHNAGWRKAWAAGDAASRGVLHGLMAMRGEPGYPAALTTPVWGLSDVVMRGNPIVLDGPLSTHIVEHVLFTVPLPLVEAKFRQSLRQSFSTRRQKHISRVCRDYSSMKSLPFNRFMELFSKH